MGPLPLDELVELLELVIPLDEEEDDDDDEADVDDDADVDELVVVELLLDEVVMSPPAPMVSVPPFAHAARHAAPAATAAHFQALLTMSKLLLIGRQQGNPNCCGIGPGCRLEAPAWTSSGPSRT